MLGWDGTVDAVRVGTKTLKILRPISEKEAENVSVLHLILLILEFQMRASCLSRASGMTMKQELRSRIHWD